MPSPTSSRRGRRGRRVVPTLLLPAAILIAATAAVVLWTWRREPHTPDNPSARHETASPRPTGADAGAALAAIYCSSCHLAPEPGELDRETWILDGLPSMVPWLGLAPPPADTLADGARLEDPAVYPAAARVTEEEWRAIQAYYVERSAPGPLPRPERAAPQTGLELFQAQRFPYERNVPMTLSVAIDSTSQTLYVGDALTRTLEAVHVGGERRFTVEFDSGPVALRLARGRIDATLIGRLFPSDQIKGRLVTLTPRAEAMGMTEMLSPLRRPTDAAFGDLNGDGREDVVVCQFGHRHGRLSWFEANGGGGFTEHLLLDRPGPAAARIADVNGDGRPDILAVSGQAWEGVDLFVNHGSGTFEAKRLVERPPTFGYTSLETADMNGDGHTDFITVNGDNGDGGGGPRPYHGLRLHLNDGQGAFAESWFLPMDGAYRALARDFDGDGDLDLAAIAYFPDYRATPNESFLYWENRGEEGLVPWALAEASLGRWICLDAGDLDGDGDEDLALGSLIMGPTTTPIPAALEEAWRRSGPAVLWLRNTSR